MKKKTIAILTSAAMVFCVTVGTTLAWLQAETENVVNTFTVGDINITLDETNVDKVEDTEPDRDTVNTYKLVPGNTYVKDPMITVEKGSEECFIFVEIVEANNAYTDLDGKVIQYGINETDWTPVAQGSNVYYYKDTIDATDSQNDVFVNSTVLSTTNGKNITINPNLTKEMLEGIEAAEDAAKPKITFKAYAVQAANMDDAVTAWTSTFGVTTP